MSLTLTAILIRWVRVTDSLVRDSDGWRIARRRHVPFLHYESPTTAIDFPGVGGKDPDDLDPS